VAWELVQLADSNSQMGCGIQKKRGERTTGDGSGFSTFPSDGGKCKGKKKHCPAGAGLSRREKEMEAIMAIDSSRCRNHAEDIESSWSFARESLILICSTRDRTTESYRQSSEGIAVPPEALPCIYLETNNLAFLPKPYWLLALRLALLSHQYRLSQKG
jgi:hypothetical protein